MKDIFFIIVFCIQLASFANAEVAESLSTSKPSNQLNAAATQLSSKKIKTLLLVGIDDQETLELKWRKNLDLELKNCAQCLGMILSIKDLSSTKAKNLLDEKTKAADVLLLTWNEKIDKDNQDLISLFNNSVTSGKIIVATVDRAKEGQAVAPLARTIAGKISKSLIIADLNRKEDLLEKSFYGPEILTGIKKDENEELVGVAALKFAVGLVRNLDRRPKDDWVDYLKNRKMHSKRIWPSIEEMFR